MAQALISVRGVNKIELDSETGEKNRWAYYGETAYRPYIAIDLDTTCFPAGETTLLMNIETACVLSELLGSLIAATMDRTERKITPEELAAMISDPPEADPAKKGLRRVYAAQAEFDAAEAHLNDCADKLFEIAINAPDPQEESADASRD